MILSCLKPALLFLAENQEATSFLKNQTIWRVINLLIFVLILVYVFRNKIKIGQVFDNRGAKIVKELEQAKREKQEAEQKLAEVESRLSHLDEEVARIRAEAEAEREREAARISQSATADAEKVRQTARREIEGAMKAARTELRAFVAEQSVGLAETIIRREIRPDDNTRMLNKYIDELREVSK